MSLTRQPRNFGCFLTAHIIDEVNGFFFLFNSYYIHIFYMNLLLWFFKTVETNHKVFLFIDLLNTTNTNKLQPYGEIDPNFVEGHFAKLGATFTIMDIRGRCMNVNFNQNYNHPLIIKGWIELRAFFCINGNRFLLMTYHGDNLFSIDVGQRQFNPLELPSYHSYRYSGLEPEPFQVTLTKFSAKKFKLVSFFIYYLSIICNFISFFSK